MPSLIKDENCIFCKIIAGQLPCCKVYEDAAVIAFLDINPIVHGHTLVVPKNHYPTILELPFSEGGALTKALKVVGGGLLHGTKANGFNCVQNNFSAAGQMVFHVHWHLIPRFDNDQLLLWPNGKYADMDQMQKVASTISKHIANA